MPVRLTIQSESNPSRAWRWSLETTASGTYFPDPTIRSPIRDRHGGRTVGRSVVMRGPWGGGRAPGTGGDYRKRGGDDGQPAAGAGAPQKGHGARNRAERAR